MMCSMTDQTEVKMPSVDATLEQGSPEWLQARCGSLGASRIGDAIAKTKSGWGASRENLMAELAIERITGKPTETYVSAPMQWGKDNEDDARTAYEFRYDVEVKQVGLIRHPTIRGTHASPDGLVGDDGMVEIKCPNSATHIATLKGAVIPLKYRLQCQWQMICADRQWCDWVSFDPRMPESMRMECRRIHREDSKVLEADVKEFLDELEEGVAWLNEKFAA